MMWLCAAVMFVMVGIAVVTDVRGGKIYNSVTLPGAITGLVLNATAGGLSGENALHGAIGGVVESLLGIAVGIGVFLVSSLFGRILGGGDIKLLMAIGAIQGPIFLSWTIVYMALAGGVMAIGVMMFNRDLFGGLRRLFAGITMRLFAKVPIDVADNKPTTRLPYALPIAVGSAIAFYVLNFYNG